MLRILLSYSHFPISVGRFFKMGFRSLPRVEVFSVGPCSHGLLPWQPQTDFSAYADVPDLELYPDPSAPYQYPIQDVLREVPFAPDAIVMVDAGFHLHGGAPLHKCALIATDPHCLDYFEQAGEVNAFFVMQKAYMSKYEVDKPPVRLQPQWLPYCYEPSVHYWDPDAPKEQNVTFVGVLYPERIELLERMVAAGVSVRYEQGRLMEEGTAIYNRGDIAWNLSSRDDLPMRFWEGMAYRNLVVTNRVSDLKDLQAWNLYENKHYIAYNREDPGELMDKLRYYTDRAHADELEAIATAGWVWVQRHTYGHRARMVLNALGLTA